LAIDPDVTGQELDKSTRGDLRSLSEDEAARVAKHLVMVARYIDDDPQLAYQHAVSARSGPGSRLATVREAAGLAAYRAGQYSEALADLRAAHRISGSPDLLPLIADSERGLGRPERALAIFESPEARTLDTTGKVEILLVAAGARRDLGEVEAALAMLRVPLLESAKRGTHIARLRAGYADVLRELGRDAEAQDWLIRAVEADPDDETGVASMLEDAVTYDDAEFLDLEEDDLGYEEEIDSDEDGDLVPEVGTHDESDADDDAQDVVVAVDEPSESDHDDSDPDASDPEASDSIAPAAHDSQERIVDDYSV
jgi:tetratricopeptide (TPR) repeat protein